MNTIYKHAEIIISTAIVIAIVAAFVTITLWYGNTEVALKVQDDTLYRQIKNGRVGADCYDQDGVEVIAPSRIAGPDWVPIASLVEIPKEGKTYSITCYPYASISDVKSVNDTISLVGMR